MAQRERIIVHQTLHGYQEGHRLLATSIELNASEKTILSQLSDSSGTGKEKNFTSYLSGYPLSNSRFYAFARTWYADEMPRPGCVWTHTLLVDIGTIWKIKDTNSLLQAFTRPFSNTYSAYHKPLELEIGEESLHENFSKSFYELTCLLYSDEKKLAILSESSSEFENIILQIWKFQWPKLKRNFKFCTGSLSFRKLGGEFFDLQVIPYTRERTLNRHEISAIQFGDPNERACKADWVNDYEMANKLDVLEFMTKYGSDFQISKELFSALFKCYSFLSYPRTVDFNNLFSFWKGQMPNPSEGSQLKIMLAESFFANYPESRYNILLSLGEDEYWKELHWDFSSLIIYAWKEKSLSQIQIVKLLKRENESGRSVKNILLILPPKIWLDNFSLYGKYIAELAEEIKVYQLVDFWKSSEVIKNAWWEYIKLDLKDNYVEVVISMLNNSNGDFAQEVLMICGEKIFSVLFGWMERTNKSLIPEWQYLIIIDPIGAFNQIAISRKMTIPMLKLFFSNVSPTIPGWRKVSSKNFLVFFKHLESLSEPVYKTAVYTYFLTACFTKNVLKPESIVTTIFQPLHDLLEKDVYEKDSWQRFKMELGRDLYSLLELDFFSKHFKDRQEVPDWDRCEFLRRSLLSAFLKLQWDIELLPKIITDTDTFEKIVAFGVDVKPIKKMLKNLKRSLEYSKESISYYRILKNEI